ncbi:MAG: glycosyltransferase [Candidatus Saccharibacteria bacterium]|nr:glycosyltransferase [Candidatus Saccharibacteria bacterium]
MSGDFVAKNTAKAVKSASARRKPAKSRNSAKQGVNIVYSTIVSHAKTYPKKFKYKVSVCVPIYNAQKYLKECLDSLIGQSLKELQIVCVDDGSTDGSLKILKEYAKKYRNIKIIHQKNQGLGGARNTGIANADGEYVGFVDADDFVEKNMFEKLYNLAKQNNCDIAMCNLKFTDKNTKKHLWYKPYTGKIDGDFLDRNIQPWNKIVSRKLLDRTKFEFYPKNGDDMFIVLMLEANGIISTDERLYHYRIEQGSMSTSFKVQNFINFINCTDAQIINYKNTKYAGKLDEYFEYRMIYVLIQSLAIFAMKKEKKLFKKYKALLKSYNYKRNPFVKSLLKKEFSTTEYYGMLHILPINYTASSVIARLKLGSWK